MCYGEKIFAVKIFIMFKNFLNSRLVEYQTFVRRKMLEDQIISRGVKDGMVLQAMEKVKRHLFVDCYLGTRAYEDAPLPIAENQTISQPYIVALMTELLALKGGEKVLEIGTGSGYQTAVLAELAKAVYTVELFPSLAEKAKATLASEGYANIHFKTGNGTGGWPANAPYEAIVITCAAPEAPIFAMGDQLTENGRLVAPVSGKEGQRLTLYTKHGTRLTGEFITDVRFVPMLQTD